MQPDRPEFDAICHGASSRSPEDGDGLGRSLAPEAQDACLCIPGTTRHPQGEDVPWFDPRGVHGCTPGRTGDSPPLRPSPRPSGLAPVRQPSGITFRTSGRQFARTEGTCKSRLSAFFDFPGFFAWRANAIAAGIGSDTASIASSKSILAEAFRPSHAGAGSGIFRGRASLGKRARFGRTAGERKSRLSVFLDFSRFFAWRGRRGGPEIAGGKRVLRRADY